MKFLDRIAERRIRESVARGELSGLPGQGRPLRLDDDMLIPLELRMAFRILRNAGFVAPEVSLLRDISELEAQIEALNESRERDRALRKLQMLRFRLDASGRFNTLTRPGPEYSRKLMMRLGHRDGVDAPESALASVIGSGLMSRERI